MFNLEPGAFLAIVRHAEAFKNLHRIHGGGVQELTPNGINQARDAANRVVQACLDLEIKPEDIAVYCQSEKRSQYTAEYIAKTLNRDLCIAENISGIGLGIIADLNENDLAKEYPEVTKALSDWRSGTKGLKSYPRIPGSESTETFAVRISANLEMIVSQKTCTILVATTSVINMLTHLLLHNGVYVRDEYAYSDYPLSGFTIWKLDDQPKMLFSNF